MKNTERPNGHLSTLKLVPKSEYKVGNFILNESTRTLHFEHQIYHLREKIYAVFFALLSAKGNLLKRDFLIDSIWEGNRYVGHNSLTSIIYMLRRIFDSDPNKSLQIITSHKVGYYIVIR